MSALPGALPGASRSLTGLCGHGQKPLDFAHDARDLFLVRKGDHEELVPLLETDQAVAEQPDSVKKRITTKQPANRRARDMAGLKNLRPHRSARRATKRPKQWCAYILDDLPFELDSFALGFVKC